MKTRWGGGGKLKQALLVMNAVEEDDCLWSILLHRGCAGSGALAKKRTAPVGCVGWRFRHDSLGSHACLHWVYGPKKNPKLKQGTRQAWQLQIVLRGCVEQLNLPWNKCKVEEEGEAVTISAIVLLNNDSGFTFFTAE